MKKFLLFSLAVLFFSCGKDDCTKEQFIGTWEGTYSCLNWGSGDVVIDVTSGSSSSIVIDEDSNGINPDFFSSVTLQLDDCSAEKSETILGSGTTYRANLSEGGNVLVLKYIISAFGASVEDCTYTLAPKM